MIIRVLPTYQDITYFLIICTNLFNLEESADNLSFKNTDGILFN